MEDQTTAGKRRRGSMPRSVRRARGSNGGVLPAVRDAGASDFRRARWRVTDIWRWVGDTCHGGPSRQRGAGGNTATVRQCPLAQWGQRLGSWPVTRESKACAASIVAAWGSGMASAARAVARRARFWALASRP